MRILVFQHIAIEHPGVFRDFLAEDGIAWDAVELDAGETIPALDNYDALWVMGGPMDVWQEEQHPWLRAEKRAIRTAVLERDMPYFGFCLGHQLLADALGGTCGPQRPPEIGVLDIELTPEGCADPLFAGMGRRQKCLQWHSVRVAQPPDGAVVLAGSSACRVQAMRVGERAWSMQYHVEVEPDTVATWGAVPAYREALAATLGPDALSAMAADAGLEMPGFLTSAERLYANFSRMVREKSTRFRAKSA